MVPLGCETCPYCGGRLKFYDVVSRRLLDYERETTYISIRRLVCTNCRRTHRELPDFIVPYRHYRKEVIFGSRQDLIDDYPCEMTLKRWSRIIQCL